MIDIAPDARTQLQPRICVVGVGGGGGNAVANMIRSGIHGVEFIVANTDAQALNSSAADGRLQLGRRITQGLGAGAAAEIGKAAAQESIGEIEIALEGAHMCFIAAGMGGGTGSGAAPIVAAAARAKGILTVGVVTKPFQFEGRRRAAAAEAAIEELARHVDTLIVIPNDNLFRLANPNTTFLEAFALADRVLEQGVRSITDLIVMTGTVNLDFADVRSIMQAGGKAVLGTGEAAGDDRAIRAAEMAISNPLLDGSIAGARGVIISIAGGDDMRLMEIDEAACAIRNMVDPDADIIWGSSFDPALDGRIRVSIVVTGIDGEAKSAAAACPIESEVDAAIGTAATVAIENGFLVVSEPASPEQEPAATTAMPARPVDSQVPGVPEPILLLDTIETTPPAFLQRHEQLSFDVDMAPAPRALTQNAAPIVIKAERREPTPPSLFQRMSMLARGSRPTIAPRSMIVEQPGVYRRKDLLATEAA